MDPVHLPIWNLQIFHKTLWKFDWLKFLKKIVIFATTVSKPKFQNSVKKLRSFGGSTSELVSFIGFIICCMDFLMSRFLIKECVDYFHSLGYADYGPVHLPLWKQGDFHSLDNADYGPVHLALWNLDDFHSLDNANYRSGPSATIKPRWFSFFGQCRLWVRSICHF